MFKVPKGQNCPRSFGKFVDGSEWAEKFGKKMMESGSPSDSSFVEKYCMYICNVNFKESFIIKTNKKSTLKFGAFPEKYLAHKIALSYFTPSQKSKTWFFLPIFAMAAPT